MNPYIIALLAIFFWGTTSTAAKFLLGGIPQLEMLFLTSIIASAALLVICIGQKKLKLFRKLNIKDYAILTGLGTIGIFLYTALYNFGISQLLVQEATITNYLWPILIVFFSWPVLGEKLNTGKVVAILISFAGIIVMVTRLNFHSFRSDMIPGILACLCAAALYGLFSAINKKFEYDQTVAMLIYHIVSAIGSGIGMLIFETPILVTGRANVLVLLWLGIFGEALGYLLWNIALVKGETARISNLAYLTPFLSIVIAWIVLGEAISIYALVGLLLIMAGILIQLKTAKKER